MQKGFGFLDTTCIICAGAGVEAEKVGVDAASELLRNVDDGGCVDEFLQDQVISLFALSVCLSVSVHQGSI